MIRKYFFTHIFPTLAHDQCRTYVRRQRVSNHRWHKRTVGIIAAVILFTFTGRRLLSGIFILTGNYIFIIRLITGAIISYIRSIVFIDLFIRYHESILSITPRNTGYHKSRHQRSKTTSYLHNLDLFKFRFL